MATRSRENEINRLAVVIVVAVGLVVGLSVFWVMRGVTENLLRRSLESNLAVRAHGVARDLTQANHEVELIASRSFLVSQVAAGDRGQPVSPLLTTGLHSLLRLGFSAIILRTRQGTPIGYAGRFTKHPQRVVRLHGFSRAQLLWTPRLGFVFQRRVLVRQHGRPIGKLAAEIRLPAFDSLFRAVKALNVSANLTLCAPQGRLMACFPNTAQPHYPIPIMARSLAGRVLPMSYALAGRAGFTVRQNYQKRQVAAAYTPVAHLGLGMVLSMDMTALEAPIWQRLGVILFLVCAALVAAIFALRWRLAPLVADLVSSERAAREAIRLWRGSEDHVRAVLQNIDDGIITISETGLVETINPAGERLFGYSKNDIVGKNISILMPDLHRSHHDGYLKRYLETGVARIIGSGRELVARRRDGGEFPIDLRVSEFILDGQRRFIGTIRDTSGRKVIENRMQHMATHDALTNLPNRTLIQIRITQLIRRTDRSGQFFAVMFVDLDHFKVVNDSLGHDVGDQLLCLIARRLMDLVRAEDTVGRLGGDEFIVIAANLVAPLDASLIADKLVKALSAPYMVEDRSVTIGASIGIALYPRDGRSVDALLKHSDRAMYQAKSTGRNTYYCSSESKNEIGRDRLALVSELHRALSEDQFVLYYQPLVQFQDGKVKELEAQMRWRHPVHGLMLASEFLSLAEEAGLAMPLGEWMVRQVCRDVDVWGKQGLTVPRVLIKLSAWQFRDRRFAKVLITVLRETGTDPIRLGVEITEDHVMESPEEAIEILARWSSAGVKVSLDEFGVGYSSVSYLKRLPLNSLKIASSFIGDSYTNADDGAWVRVIIDMTHELGIPVIASGVDSEGQYAFLRLSGCDAYQGEWGGRPLPAVDCTAYLAPPAPPLVAVP